MNEMEEVLQDVRDFLFAAHMSWEEHDMKKARELLIAIDRVL